MLPVHFKFIPQDSPGLISNPGIRECHLTSGKVILHGVLTQKVTLGHLKFIPKTSPGVIGNLGIRVCHLTSGKVILQGFLILLGYLLFLTNCPFSV